MRSRVLACAVAAVLVLSACGGGGEDEARAAVIEMLERLGNSPNLAECLVDEFDGEYTSDDFQSMIDQRLDPNVTISFELIEDLALARQECVGDG